MCELIKTLFQQNGAGAQGRRSELYHIFTSEPNDAITVTTYPSLFLRQIFGIFKPILQRQKKHIKSNVFKMHLSPLDFKSLLFLSLAVLFM